MRRVACINVDIDNLHLYYRIHGLEEPPSSSLSSLYPTAVNRFLDLFSTLDIRATFFAVGEDLLAPENQEVARRIIAEGHELASHSFTHPYDLILLSRDEIRRELIEAEHAIEGLTGQRPRGFRAPGYNTSSELLELLVERGYTYDSSFFPCPPYLMAKAAAIGLYRIFGHPSRSVLGDYRAAFAKRLPHRINTKDGGSLIELPITVTPAIRFPLIGTSLIAFGMIGWKLVRPLLSKTPFINLEFHAIDMTDHKTDGINSVLSRQPDQRTPLEQKEAVFRSCLEHLSEHWQIQTLSEVADSIDV